LVEFCYKGLAGWGEKNKWSVISSKGKLKLTKAGKTMSIQMQNGSLTNLETILKTHSVQLVTANAVMDLLTYKQLKKFIEPLSRRNIALLLTINYQSMAFSDNGNLEKFYITLFNKHMQRKQKFGKAMGPHCTGKIEKVLKAHGYSFIKGESPWKVSPNQRKMLIFILKFIQETIPDLLKNGSEIKKFFDWTELIKKKIKKQSLSLTINHSDIYAWKPKQV